MVQIYVTLYKVTDTILSDSDRMTACVLGLYGLNLSRAQAIINSFLSEFHAC